jgi:hypothetical protein
MKKIIKKSDFKHGQWFRANINDDYCIGRISIEDNTVYLCQDTHNGSDADDKLGFTYSWQVNKGSASDVKANDVTNLELLSRKPASYKAPVLLPSIGSFKVVLKDDGETVQVGCTPVSRELYLAVGRKAGWIE